MVQETIFQHWIVTQFILPFLLIFLITFAILQKTKVLGEKKQLEAIISFVVAFIFVSAFSKADIINNLILFLTIALVVIFVALLLWGFVSGGDKVTIGSSGLKWVIGIVIVIAVILALLWASGYDISSVPSFSESFWINVSFVVIVAVALAIVYYGIKD